MEDAELDKVIHQPIRTRIMAFLVNVKECDYTSLKKTLNLTDGHMTTHMRELLSHEYVEMEKDFVDNKPRTRYRVTKEGKKKFSVYVNSLRALIGK
jgi:DNA-binding MarR family transcriptional regulator